MMKKIVLLLFTFMTMTGFGQTARVQLIHNSPDVLTEEIDVYFGNQRVLDSMEFRTATPYLNVPANTDIVVAIQSLGFPDTVSSLFRDTVRFEADSTYVVIMGGLVSLEPYDSLKPFEFDIYPGREEAVTNGKMEMLMYHGGTDGPPLGINETTQPISGLVPNLQYSEFNGYIELDPMDYEFDVMDLNEQNLLASYMAPFDSWGWEDSAFVVVASGLIDTAQSMPGDSTASLLAPLFGLWAASPGGGPLRELPAISGIGLEEYASNRLNVYPVPADNYMYIDKPPHFLHTAEAELTTLAGQLVFESTLKNESEKRYRLDLSKVEEGFYVLKLKSHTGEIYSRKIFVR